MAGKMTEVARATVTIIPNMEGAQKEISNQITGATDKAADKAGKEGGKTLRDKLAEGLSGDNWKKAGDTMSKCITVPVLAAAGGAVAAWQSVDEAMDTVATKTGASGAALEDMQDRVKNIATTIPTSFEDAGTAIGEVNTRFGLTGDALESLSTQFIEFATINGTDVNSSIDTVQKALSAFGLSADDAGAMLDALNVAGQESGVSVDQLAANLTTNATAFQQMGFSAQDSINLLSTLEKSGVDTSTVMTGLSKVQQNAAKEGISMQDAFSEALSSSQGAIDVFGAKAGPKLYESFQNGTLSVEDFTAANASLTESLGSTEATYNETLDPMDKFTVVMNQIKEAGAGVIDAIGPTLASVLQTLSDMVQKATDAWNSLSPGMQDAIVKGALLAAAIGPAIKAVQGITGAFSFLTSPVGIAVAAIAGAIAIGVAIYKNWDTISAQAKKIWNAIKDTIVGVWNGIKSAVSSAISAVQNTVTGVWNAITSVTSSVWNGIKSTIGGAINGAKDTVSGAINAIKGFFSGLSLKFPKLDTSFIETAKNTILNGVNAIKGFFSGLHLSLPHISLPHFRLSGGFSLRPPSVPHLSVDWYAKAYDTAAMFSEPTIVGYKGFGDGNGNEFVVGEQHLREIIRGESKAPNITINVNGAGSSAKEIAQEVNRILVHEFNRNKAVYA